MRRRDNFEQINIEFPKDRKIRERLKKLAILHHRSVNKELLYLLEKILAVEEQAELNKYSVGTIKWL